MARPTPGTLRAGLATELLDLSIDGAFTLWRWQPSTGRVESYGSLDAGGFEEWIDRVHPDEAGAVLDFMHAAIGTGRSASICEYRWRPEPRSDWRLLRHALRERSGDEPGTGWVEGIIEQVTGGPRSQSLLDIAERDLREGESRLADYLTQAQGLARLHDPLPLLRLLKSALRAEAVAYIPLDPRVHHGTMVAATSDRLAGEFAELRVALPGRLSARFEEGEPAGCFPLDLGEGKVRSFLVSPVALPNSPAAAAVCAGFPATEARALATRFESLLCLTATLYSCRLGNEIWNRHCRELLAEVKEARFRGTAVKRAIRAATTIEEKIESVGAALQRFKAQPPGDDAAFADAIRDLRGELASAKDTLGIFRDSLPSRPQLRPVDLNRLIERTVAMLDGILRDSVALLLDLDAGLKPVLCDETSLREALLLLILEAQETSVERGILTLSTRWRPRHDRPGGDHAIFWISYLSKECGDGEQPRSGADDPVRSLLEDAGIQVSRGRDVHDGVTVRLDFPCEPPAPAFGAGHRGSQGRFATCGLQGTKILLVEDQMAVRKLVRKLLEVLGCDVIEVGSGREALDLWPSVQDQVRLVLSDVVMPGGVSGWDLARELHQRHPDLAILLTSGHAAEMERYGLDEESGVAFLQKPYGVDTLRESMAGLLRGETL